MPLMKYTCHNCQEQFLRFSRLGKAHQDAVCPSCKSANVTMNKSVAPTPALKAGGPGASDISSRGRRV